MAITVNTNGFDINFAASIDKRLIVDRVNGTTASLVSLQPVYNYKNMYVWVREEKAFYYLNDVVDQINFPGATVSDWTKLISGSGSVGGSASIDFEEIAFGTGTGITSSNLFTYDVSNTNLIFGSNSITFSSTLGFNNTIIGGLNNTIRSESVGAFNLPADNNLIIGGYSNYLNSSEGGSIIGSKNSYLSFEYSSILGGNCHCTQGDGRYSSIIGGECNLLCTSTRSSIIGGCKNCIRGEFTIFETITASASVIIGGSLNTICNSFCSSIIVGSNNDIRDSKSSLISGDSNYIYDSSRSSIIGGAGNSIGTQSRTLKGISEVLNTRNVIIGGLTNEISGTSSYNSSIIGGYNNCVFKSNSSVIIGGIGLTLSNESSVVYVPKLKIATASNNDSVTKVLVWDTDDNYVKWRDASTLGSGATGCAKSGFVSGTSFTGNPATANVVFSTPYSSAIGSSYSVVVTSHAFTIDDYVYSVTSKTQYGFTIRVDFDTTPPIGPVGATAMWIANCWDGSGLSSGGSGGGNATFLPLPIPKINLMQGTQSVQVYDQSFNTVSVTPAIIHNYPVLINMDLTSDHFSNPNNRIFIEMVHYKRKSRNGSVGSGTRKYKGSSYVVPAKNLAGVGQDTYLPWISAGFWSRGGYQGYLSAPGAPADPVGIDRPNHYEVTSYTMSSSAIWEYFTGRFQFGNVAYRDAATYPGAPSTAESTVTTLIPSSGRLNAGTNHPTRRFAYSPLYTPYYCAFRYIQWIPNVNPKPSGGYYGQIVSGPLSKIIKVTGLNFPFQTDYVKSAELERPVCTINVLHLFNELKCSWVSNLP